jgi:hypothetical protein
MVLAFWDKNISGQLNALILYEFLKVLEILLEIEIYFLDPLFILLLSLPYLNVSYLAPLLIEFLFKKFTRLHVEHDYLIR